MNIRPCRQVSKSDAGVLPTAAVRAGFQEKDEEAHLSNDQVMAGSLTMTSVKVRCGL
jgi:hypothetical protein